MTSRLDTIANVATIVTSVILCVFLFSRYHDLPSTPSQIRSAIPYKPGDRMDAIHDVGYESTATVLLFVRSDCRFCTESMPFYKQLTSLDDRKEKFVRVVAISSDSNDQLATYLALYGLDLDQAVGAQRSTKITATPTLVIVDQDGVVAGCWRGLLPQDQQHKVLEIIKATVASKKRS
jgi:thioredoxin-related protein